MVKLNLNPEDVDTNNGESFSLHKVFGISTERADQIEQAAKGAFKREGTLIGDDMKTAYEAASPADPQEEAFFWHCVGQLMRRIQDANEDPMAAFMRMMQAAGE